MKKIHKLALECLVDLGNKSELNKELRNIDKNQLNDCMKGYWNFYNAELLDKKNQNKHYEKTLKYWQRHIDYIEKNEKIEILKYSDMCFWNLQISDIKRDLKYPDANNYYQKTIEYGQKCISLMNDDGDYKGELTHRLLVGYASIISNKPLDKEFVSETKKLSNLHKNIKKSLKSELNALYGILSNRKSNDYIVENLISAFDNHLLYLHKKRCKNLLRLYKNENRQTNTSRS